MKLYHGAAIVHARQMLTEGFENLTNNFGLFNAATGEPVNTTGVFFSDVVLDENEGVNSEAYLVLDIPDAELTQYEWFEEGKGYREWCIPAELANLYFLDRAIYSWEELQSVLASDRRRSTEEPENGNLPSDSFYQSEPHTENLGEVGSLSLKELIGCIYHESLKTDPDEFLALLHGNEVNEFDEQSGHILNWLISVRRLIGHDSD